MKIFYVGYPQSDLDAPHQSMAADWLARKGHEIVFPNELFAKKIDKRRGLTALCLEALRKVLVTARTLQKIQKERPDVIYIQGSQQCLIGALSLFLPKGIVKVYHTQDLINDTGRSLYIFFEKIVCRRFDHVISNDVNRARFLMSIYCLKTMPKVIPTYLPKDYLQTRARISDSEADFALLDSLKSQGYVLIAAGGGYAANRRTGDVLRAFARLDNRYKLILTGADRLSLKKHMQAEEIPLEALERCIFLPRLSYPRLLSMFERCNLGLLIYANDSFGNFYQAPGRLTEYLQAGVHPIMSNSPSFQLLSLQYRFGTVVEGDSFVDIANAIERASEVEGDSSISREALRVLARSNLNYDAHASSVFEDILR